MKQEDHIFDTFEDEEDDKPKIKLTKKEERAIARFEKLAATWPKSLTLFSNSGSLYITKDPKDYDSSSWENEGKLKNIVAEIYGIPNDGGDLWIGEDENY